MQQARDGEPAAIRELLLLGKPTEALDCARAAVESTHFEAELDAAIEREFDPTVRG